MGGYFPSLRGYIGEINRALFKIVMRKLQAGGLTIYKSRAHYLYEVDICLPGEAGGGPGGAQPPGSPHGVA